MLKIIMSGSKCIHHTQSQTEACLRRWRPSVSSLSTAQSTWSYVHSILLSV